MISSTSSIESYINKPKTKWCGNFDFGEPYLGAAAHFVDKDSKYYSVDLFCTEFKEKKKSGESM